jgi:hypothetical protein
MSETCSTRGEYMKGTEHVVRKILREQTAWETSLKMEMLYKINL